MWIRASCSGWSSESLAERVGRLGKRLAVGEPVRVPGEHAAKLLLGEPGAVRGAERDEQRARLLAVREVGRVDDLLGRDAAVQVEQVDRAPGRGVEEDVLPARHHRREVRHVGDSRVGDDQRGVGAPVDELREAVRDRRQAAAAVDQDRHAPLLGEREHRLEAVVGRVEALRPRMELDPARAGVEAAGRLLDRRLVQVEPDERDQPAVRALGERERPVVGRGEAGVAVGLVEAEHEGARDPVVGHHLLERVVVADHAVDVVAEMEVHVEDVRARRQQRLKLRVVDSGELERTGESVGHLRKLTTSTRLGEALKALGCAACPTS